MSDAPNEFCTRHIGLASFLRYVLGDDAHVATAKLSDRSYAFHFADEQAKCRELSEAFFSEAGAAIDNARDLLQCEREVKIAMKNASNSPDGEWSR